ncbi:MAG: peroxide stress protein YaaA [Crocinitomicaceae bacterium]|nr:peroxide stress protein YaaA [Crocinitomicaceae bacterium]
MKIVLSPAKSLDFDFDSPTANYTQPELLEDAETIASVLKKYSPKKIASLMSISPNLGELNYERYQDWDKQFTYPEEKQACLVFTGEVYRGLRARELSQADLEWAQDRLRILSGLYGVLKPLDLMKAYRLEMGTKLKVKSKKDLYEYWGPKIAKTILKDMDKDEVLINLASNEYFKSIDKKTFKNRIITPEFKELKGDQYKMIAVFAKKARGLMTRFIIENRIEDPEQIKHFDVEGYGFDSNLSTENNWVFTRSGN